MADMDMKTFRRKVKGMVKKQEKSCKFLDRWADEILAISKDDKKAFAALAVKRGLTKMKGRRIDKAFELFKKFCIHHISQQIILRKAVRMAGL